MTASNRRTYFLLALAVSLTAWIGILDAVFWLNERTASPADWRADIVSSRR